MSRSRYCASWPRCVTCATWRCCLNGAAWLRRAVVVLLGVMLAACAAPPILPTQVSAQEYVQALALPRRVLVTKIADGKPVQDAILIAQQEDAGILRWSLFDALGLPLARQMLQLNTWRNDGLLPPNARARQLFAALLFAWTPEADLDRAYPGGAWRESAGEDGRRTRILYHQGKTYWTIIWQDPTAADTFTIEANDGMRWLIRPLEETS